MIVGTLAAVALLRRRSELEAWALAACPGVGLLLVAVNPYGQEGIFRAVLFGIPWLAILASDLFAARTRGSSIALLVVCVCLVSTFLISSFGLDGATVIRKSDLAAVRAFEAQGGRGPTSPHYLVLLQPGDQPTTPTEQGGRHFIWGLDRLELKLDKLDELPPAQRVRLLTDRVGTSPDCPGARPRSTRSGRSRERTTVAPTHCSPRPTPEPCVRPSPRPRTGLRRPPGKGPSSSDSSGGVRPGRLGEADRRDCRWLGRPRAGRRRSRRRGHPTTVRPGHRVRCPLGDPDRGRRAGHSLPHPVAGCLRLRRRSRGERRDAGDVRAVRPRSGARSAAPVRDRCRSARPAPSRIGQPRDLRSDGGRRRGELADVDGRDRLRTARSGPAGHRVGRPLCGDEHGPGASAEPGPVGRVLLREPGAVRGRRGDQPRPRQRRRGDRHDVRARAGAGPDPRAGPGPCLCAPEGSPSARRRDGAARLRLRGTPGSGGAERAGPERVGSPDHPVGAGSPPSRATRSPTTWARSRCCFSGC